MQRFGMEIPGRNCQTGLQWYCKLPSAKCTTNCRLHWHFSNTKPNGIGGQAAGGYRTTSSKLVTKLVASKCLQSTSKSSYRNLQSSGLRNRLDSKMAWTQKSSGA